MNTLNSKLYQTYVAVLAKVNAQIKKRKRKILLWNDDIAVVVKRSKISHSEWRAAGSPRNRDMFNNAKKRVHSCEELSDSKFIWISKINLIS